MKATRTCSSNLWDKSFSCMLNQKTSYRNWYDLLADTKLRKDKVQLIFVGNGTSDFTQVMQAAPNVQRNQIAGDVLRHSLLNIVQAIADLL